MSFIELRGVTRRYMKGGHAVTPLDDVDLDVAVFSAVREGARVLAREDRRDEARDRPFAN